MNLGYNGIGVEGATALANSTNLKNLTSLDLRVNDIGVEGTTAIACWCPCIRCSLAMVSVGLNKVVTRLPDFTKEADLRWKESFERSEYLYKKAGVEFVTLNIPKPEPKLETKPLKNKKKKM